MTHEIENMKMYNYTGITFYINPTERGFRQKYQTLSNVIPALKDQLCLGWGSIEEDELKAKSAYAYLRDNKHVTQPTRLDMPVDTPEKYMHPTIEDVHMKDKQNKIIVLNRLYIPIVSDDLKSVRQYTASLITVVRELLGTQIISTKTKHGAFTENFHNLKTNSIVTVEEYNNQFAVRELYK